MEKQIKKKIPHLLVYRQTNFFNDLFCFDGRETKETTKELVLVALVMSSNFKHHLLTSILCVL